MWLPVTGAVPDVGGWAEAVAMLKGIG